MECGGAQRLQQRKKIEIIQQNEQNVKQKRKKKKESDQTHAFSLHVG